MACKQKLAQQDDTIKFIEETRKLLKTALMHNKLCFVIQDKVCWINTDDDQVTDSSRPSRISLYKRLAKPGFSWTKRR